MKATFEAPTAQNEAALVSHQLKAIQAKLQEPNLKTFVLSDCIVRAMLCSIMGYSVDFIHIYALQLAQKGTLTEKKIGYMACSMFLKEQEDLILLLINTIVRDLKSTNVLENNIALITASYLVPKEMSPMIVPILLEKTRHSKDFIRKKALICLEQITIKDPEAVAIGEIVEAVVQALTDPDPGVVIVAIQVIGKLICACTDVKVSLTDGLVSIQKQILDGKFPEEYTFHQVPAPWAQMDIIRLLRLLCEENRLTLEERDKVVELLVATVEQPFPSDHSIGQAVIFECIETLATVLPASAASDDNIFPPQGSSKVMKRMLKYLSALMKSEHNNNKYVGLCAFEKLMTHQGSLVSPHISQTERNFVLMCLDNEDDSIQRKAFALLNTLATRDNVKDICEKLICQIKVVQDGYLRDDLIKRTLLLVDKFDDTSLEWRTFVLLRLLQCAHEDAQKEALMTKIQMLLCQRPFTEERINIGLKLKGVLAKPASGDNAPESLLKLYVWCQSAFTADNVSESAQIVIEVAQKQGVSVAVVIGALKSIFVLLTKSFEGSGDSISDMEPLTRFLSSMANHESSQVQDLVCELQMILTVLPKAMPFTKDHLDLSRDYTLSYLDHVLVKALENGASSYAPKKLQVPLHANSRSPSLRFTPYNVMEESEWRSISLMSPIGNPSSASGGTRTSVPEVWTLQGRIKKVEDINTAEPIKFMESDAEGFEESVIQDLSQWNG